ncbi:hypothetical protein JDV02_004368 [Purpureocillium takamizusanense]|uniref:Protein kinase domain-containing protein n=1 Tax=Purpureocillium takamizusanense TaxID=2060973 RepID=A0A9Q8QEK6_9HYPO|nr:uncharacterized protein JDV02_004368 [Purpureocillium takamizusanense]UNI18073.1 hypothetical protein JDV02_004368 [Purpureocillium takamizusanense]
MGDRRNGWTTVGHGLPLGQHQYGRVWEAEQELRERETIASWDRDEHWPGIDRPLFSGPDAKRFDNRLVKVEDLGFGAFGRVEKVMHGTVCLARKRIIRRRGFTIEDLRQEGLTMRRLDHRHVVKLVATYAPRSHELCLLIWPAAVCNLSSLLEDIEMLRLRDGDRDDIIERLRTLDIRDLSAVEPPSTNQSFQSDDKCPFDFLRTVMGCAARAMAHCHANDVRHLDIKPTNILLRPDRVYLADFGISRDVSGQDQTTTDGLPGTEKWRAPELYSGRGSSMQLSDMYSLGLVYMNVATVLYNVRLGEFDEVLRYTPGKSREEQLRIREDKIWNFLQKLRAHALVTPPFMFTYEGQETVRPRPVVQLIEQMVATEPRKRPSADKTDEKLSMIGGIRQIYHAECCKQPMSWVEDKWDRKLAVLSQLRSGNDVLRTRVRELEGRDETYEARLENERNLHRQDVERLQVLLREAEEKCQRLEQALTSRRGSHGHGARPNAATRPVMPGVRRSGGAVGLGVTTTTRSTPTTPAAVRPAMQPSSQSTQQLPRSTPPWGVRRTSLAQAPPASPMGTAQSPAQRSPSVTNLAGYQLRSRGSGSRLPLPVTPNSRSGTPALARDQSMTDSSMASSVFSRHSVETAPTPANNSPQLQRTTPGREGGGGGGSGGIPPQQPEEEEEEQWTALPAQQQRSPSPTESRRRASSVAQNAPRPPPPPRVATPSPPGSPVLSMTGAAAASVMSSPRTLRSELLSDAGSDANSTARPVAVPSLQSSRSWAEVVSRPERRRPQPSRRA